MPPPQGYSRHVSVTDGDPVTYRELTVVSDAVASLEVRVSQAEDDLPSRLKSALNEALDGRLPSPEELRWTQLAIQREAQSIKLRQAIIEKTLTGLIWAGIVGLGLLIADYFKNHGWKPSQAAFHVAFLLPTASKTKDDFMNKYLIDNWRRAHRMLSMWVAFAAGAYSQLTDTQQLAVLRLLHVSESELLGYAALAFAVTRMVKQPAVSGTKQPAPADPA